MTESFRPGLIMRLLLPCLLACPATVQAGLVAHYPLDRNACDVSGNGYDGIVEGPVLTSDRFGSPESAYEFDGANDRIDISAVPISQNVSISAWVRTADQTSCGAIAGFDGSYHMSVHPSGAADGATKAGSTPTGAWTGGPMSTNTVADTQWHHIVWTRSTSGEQCIYVDGLLEASAVYNSGTIPVASFGRFLGCYRMHDGTYSALYHGAIDDVRFFDHVISAGDVLLLYGAADADLVLHYTFDEDSGTNVWDQSGHGNHAHLVGNVTYEAGISGLAPRFTSRSTYILSPSTWNVDGNRSRGTAWLECGDLVEMGDSGCGVGGLKVRPA